MSRFYARYVPPSKAPPKPQEALPSSSEKRKRSDETDSVKEHTKHHKKRKISEGSTNGEITEQPDALTQNGRGTVIGEEKTGHGILNKYRVSHFAKSQSEDVDIELKKTGKKKKSKRDHEEPEVERPPSEANIQSISEGLDGSTEVTNDKKHSGVFSRYEKSRKRSNPTERRKREGDDIPGSQRQLAEEVLHDLVPLPQPDNVDIEPKLPTYSTLPSWQAAAINVVASSTVRFDSLGVSKTLLSNLKSQNIEQAFPVQSTVIPLLMDEKRQSRGDLCISAATGSGKTLAYVVPIVENLRRQRKTELRAVIVVPTRELVKQVKDTCDLCAAGSTLKTVTAVGSKSLSEEQRSLIEEEEVFDPDAYGRELMTPVDWSTFSLEDTLQKARSRERKKMVNYVTRRTLKADILITTPGRLVDHLQNTKGFHLDDVRWLVVDEADRLLNESYQEWIDVVVPALRSRNATTESDRILSHMRVDLPPRIVRRILLSATMTRDISKLNSIGLTNPRMIVLESTQNVPHRTEMSRDSDEPVADAAGKYTLPELLQEVAVTFKEGSDKPLLLLQLIRNNIDLPEFLNHKNAGASRHTKSSQDPEIDTSDSESTSSSEDSDSDSETSSDSSSEEIDEAEEQLGKKPTTEPHQSASTLSSSYSGSRVLIFTRSTAAASRLSRLLTIISPHLESRIATLTRGTASSASSRKALSSFKSGKSPILIATDRASRGIDVPGLEHVISYDIPGSALTYVHRVGRTARAGRSGTSWTMVEHREGKWFWDEIGGKSGESMIQRSRKIRKMKVAVEDEGARNRYEEALQILGSEVKGS